MICTSCTKNVSPFYKVPSQLLPITLNLCGRCMTEGLEPRFAVVLAGRVDIDLVTDHIKDRRYLGAEISATELI